MTNRDIERSFEIAHRFGLHTSAFVMIGLPNEKKEDMQATVELLAKIQPGRVRWSLFFPFIGTRAYEIAKHAGQIDYEKMNILDNFTDETCMILGDEEDLYVDKLKTLFCLFLNGYANMDKQGRYLKLVKEVESFLKEDWENRKEGIKSLVQNLDKQMEEQGICYYTIKYNPFMGVRSDWKDDHLSA